MSSPTKPSLVSLLSGKLKAPAPASVSPLPETAIAVEAEYIPADASGSSEDRAEPSAVQMAEEGLAQQGPSLAGHHVGTARKDKFTLDDLNKYAYEELQFSCFSDMPDYLKFVQSLGDKALATGLRKQLIIDVGGKQTFLETDEHGVLGYHYLFKASVEVLYQKFRQDVYDRLPAEIKDEADIIGGTPAKIMAKFTKLPKQTVCDMTAERTFYNRYNGHFVRATCPPRKLMPREDKNIARWLELLGGESHERLLDWLASCTDLSMPTCALYFHGATRGGKSLLALGLNRYWNTDEKPTPLWRYFDTFNNDVVRSGILLADEELGLERAKFSTTNLRDLITSGAHDIFTKHQDPSKARGCFRVIMASNHANMLDLDAKGLDPNSLEAVSLRFLPVEVTKEPADFIRSIGGQAGGTQNWVDGDLIIRHALWLKETRKVKPGNNGLLVEGNLAASRSLLVATGPADTVLGLLADIVDDISRVSGLEGDTVFIGDNKIYIVMDKLRMYLDKTMRRGYQRRTLGNALTNLQRTTPIKRPAVLSFSGTQTHPRAFDIDPQYLFNYMNQTKSGDPDKLIDALKAEQPIGNKGVVSAFLGISRAKGN